MENKKKKKIRINPKKLLKFLILACIIVGITKFVLDINLFDDTKIQNRVNSSLPLSVTMEDALYIKTHSINNYVTFLMQGETTKAYSMLTEEYQSHKTYNEYLKDIEGIDFSTFKLKEVKLLSENTYVAPVEYERNGKLEETDYLILVNKVNSKNMKIAPDKFLYEFKEKAKFSEDSIKFTVEKCIVNSDVIKMTVNIKNSNWIEKINIKEVGVAFSENESKTEVIEDCVLNPNESQTFEIELESNYYVPKYLKIVRNIDEKLNRTYMFAFEEE